MPPAQTALSIALIKEDMASAYDAVAYPGFPFAQTHPDRLATIATLMGMQPAPVERCRVLELACGDGGNLIPMAAALPGSRFVGVDLAKKPIASGNRMIADLRLRNITLTAGDLRRIRRKWGEFDYIIAHGIYSWSPAEVQDHILRIARENLAPQGVAFVSYNALPGGRLRQMVREMLLYHTRGTREPVERAAAARSLINVLSTSDNWLAGEVERLREREDWALFHDEMAEFHTPVHFHEFAAQAARHGLQYLAEADYTEEALAAFGKLTADRLEQEQYLDFVKCRRFRQTLLCHGEVKLNWPPAAEMCRGLMTASPARPVSRKPDLRAGVTEEFEGPRGARMKTANAMAKQILLHLIATWPARVPFEDLYDATRAHADSDFDLERMLLFLYSAGMVELHSWGAPAVSVPGAQPRAWKMARFQAAHGGSFLTSLLHASVEASRPLELQLVGLLNGRRDRKEIRSQLRSLPAAELESMLWQLAKAGLLDR